MITIYGNIASKKNSKRVARVKGRLVPFPSKAWERFEANVHAQLVRQGLLDPFRAEVFIHVKALIFYKGPRPDLSGALESIGDVFEKFLWQDDRQIRSWDGSRLYHDKNNPRIELYVKRFDE